MGLADYDGRTALHLAAAEGHKEFVVFLLEECRVNINAKDRWGKLPINEAKRFRRKEVLDYLQWYYKDHGLQCPPLPKVLKHIQLAADGNRNELRKMAEEGYDLATADYDDRTALHLAAAEGHMEVVKFLLEGCQVPPDPVDRWGQLPINEAKRFRRKEVLDYLQRYHNEQELLCPPLPEVLKHIQLAADGDLLELQNMAYEGYDLATADYDGRTALHLAAAEGHVEVVKFLLEGCQVPPEPLDRWDNVPRDEAERFDRTHVKDYLRAFYLKSGLPWRPTKKESRTDPYVQDFKHIALASKGDIQALRKMADEGHDLSKADYDGRTALHLAAAEGHLGCVVFLLEICHVPPQPKDRWDRGPIDDAKEFKLNEVVVDYLQQYYKKHCDSLEIS